MRRILFQQTDFNSLPNPPAGFKYIGFNGPNFSEKDEDGQINQNLGATGSQGPQGATGPQGPQGATGPQGPTGSTVLVSTDRLISTNDAYNLELILDNKGTINTPLLFPLSFIAVCDGDHMIDPVGFADASWWEFEVHFAVNPDGTIETQINNIFPTLSNPGYVSGYTFRFTEADHGIPNFNFDIQLNDVMLPGGAGWTANLAVTLPPVYPSTINTLGAIKLTSNSNSLILSTNGDLILPQGGDIKDVNGNSVLGNGITSSTVLPYLELTNDAFIFNPYDGDPISFTKDDYATGTASVDEIDTNIAITRSNQRGIYNPHLEPDWDNDNNSGPSPEGTLWNNQGWGDLTNLNQRTYYTFYYALNGSLGNNVLSAELVMKDVANNKYYKFDFTTWGNQNNGAPIAYTRTEIDPVNGTEIGSPVTFTKPAYADPFLVNDVIDTDVTISRGNNQGIFNVALENSWTTNGYISPSGTEWNSDGWSNLKNITQRNYSSFYDSLGGQIGNNIINTELIMHDMINDKYYAVKFSGWTTNGNGGGFSYTRQLLSTTNLFIKPDNTNSVVDIFVEDDGSGSGIGITRDYNGGIYNPYREGSWDDNVSPGGTLWNIEGWNNLDNILSRDYKTFYNAFGQGGLGNKVPGTECIMYIPETGEYYAIKFTSWTQSGGGGFTYLRYKIDTTKLNEGIKFADGSVLKSADDFNKIKSKASGQRKIEEVYGSKTVSVTQINTVNVTATASRSVVGDSRIWVDRFLSTFDDITNNYSNYGILDYTNINFSIDNTNWYSWNGSTSGDNNGGDNERGFGINTPLTYNEGDTLYMRYLSGGAPQVWWDKNDLPSGGSNFRGATIDYHAYTGQATFIGTIHIVSDTGSDNITHTEVSSGSSDSENDDLWFVQNEGTISYRRMDGESKTLKIHWGAKVFYGSEFYD